MTQKPFTILICALGGEGGGVLTDWLVNTARISNTPIQATSIPGVAQRTGATTYYLELMTSTINGANHPVFGLSPLPGQIDLLISSELLETGRQISNGMSSPTQTCVISSSNRTLTTQERMGLADSRIPDQELIELIQQFSRTHHLLDMAQLAKESGTIISSVMLGCIAACGLLPFKKEHYEKAIQGASRELSASQKASLEGFRRGWDAIEQHKNNTKFVESVLHSIETTPDQQSSVLGSEQISDEVLKKFPAQVHEILKLGYARLVEYQNQAYANMYLEKMLTVCKAEEKANQLQIDSSNTEAQDSWAITNETARWTALWMAFDDIVRVAQLKIKQKRFDQIRKDTKAQSGDILKVYDHFKPGIPEIAGLLPHPIADKLLRWEQLRIRSGHQPLELKLKVDTSSITGTLALRFLSHLKWLRRYGRRYKLEMQGIDSWLESILQSTQTDKALGLEVAACGRLIKGYGSTNERAHENLSYILKSLSDIKVQPSNLQKFEIVRQARLNALKDESGKPLDLFLKGLGAPARLPKEQPIRWMRRPIG